MFSCSRVFKYQHNRMNYSTSCPQKEISRIQISPLAAFRGTANDDCRLKRKYLKLGVSNGMRNSCPSAATCRSSSVKSSPTLRPEGLTTSYSPMSVHPSKLPSVLGSLLPHKSNSRRLDDEYSRPSYTPQNRILLNLAVTPRSMEKCIGNWPLDR